MSLAVLILTCNEENNIADCIKSVQFADEIVVIDSGSSDRTEEIAKSAGARVVNHSMDEGFAAQRNFALTRTECQWVLFLDADERITPELAEEISGLVHAGEQFAYEILRMNVVFGQLIRHGGHSPDYSLRLYPRHAIIWDGIVHEKAIVSLPVKRTRHAMMHYTYTDWERYFQKFNHYTTLMAERALASGKRARFTDILLRPGFAFFRNYILKAGFLDGKLGFILAVLGGFYTMVKYLKIYYRQQKRRAC